MSFLNIPNIQRRLFLQMLGFQSDTYLSIVSNLLDVSTFRLPKSDFIETDIQHLLMPENLRLGKRLERFFSFIIEASERYEILAKNLQIIKNKITLGELDFIIYDSQTKQTLHVELTGKLYLYDPVFEEELERWIGPNRRDSLLLKINKLHDKQLPLLYNSTSKEYIEHLGVVQDKTEQQICFKARLYLPYAIRNTIPKFVSSKNIKGYYLRLQEFLNPLFESYSYFIPEKQDWIVHPKHGEIWYSHAEILKQIEISLLEERSPMLWVRTAIDRYETLFVVWW